MFGPSPNPSGICSMNQLVIFLRGVCCPPLWKACFVKLRPCTRDCLAWSKQLPLRLSIRSRMLELSLQDSSTTVAGNQPLCQWSVAQDAVRKGRCADLLLNLQVQECLKHPCPLCFQWLATTTSVKCHLTRQHPVWTACHSSSCAVQILSSWQHQRGSTLEAVPCSSHLCFPSGST